MFRKLKKISLKYAALGVLILAIMHHFNFFLSIYDMFTKSYQERMKFVYGNCGKESYGYLHFIESKFKFKKNIQILNAKSYPSSSWFFYKVEKNFDNNYLIILNYTARFYDQNQISNDQNIFPELDFNKFRVINKKENCYLLKRI